MKRTFLRISHFDMVHDISQNDNCIEIHLLRIKYLEKNVEIDYCGDVKFVKRVCDICHRM